MKQQNIYSLLSGLLAVGVLISQDIGEEIEKKIEDKVENELRFVFDMDVNEKHNDPKLGLYLSDLDFQDAYEMHYDQCFGVLVTDIVSGGNADKAGLVDDDIIMEFDGEKVRYEDHLLRLRDAKKIGDSVELKFFRDGETKNTTLIFDPEVLDSDNEEEDEEDQLSVGFGGGGPMIFMPQFDFAGINQYINYFGFESLSSSAAAHFGGFGMGTIGNGWFIGGMGGGIMVSSNIFIDSLNITRTMKLESGLGGVTVTKKFPLFTEKLILDFTTMIGGGETTLSVSQNSGGFSWDDDQISNGSNWYAKYRKSFFALYPKVGILLRIKNWFGLYGSAGQLITLSTDDHWTEDSFNTMVGGESPDVPNGLTYSVGVWFGY